MSTGFEAIWGYLDLAGKTDRVEELTLWCIQTVEDGGINNYDFK